jgi:UDP-2,3-diacylglucosamine hydrolase
MTTVPRFAALDAPAHWRTVDFISDLHLQPGEPGTLHAWQHYLAHTPADAVFILGDLFEAWVGDDCATPGSFEARCGQLLHAAGATRALFFMCGNRDFLVGPAFLAQSRMQPLADPTVLALAGQRWLLTHGDLLCTDDVAYQQFRAQVRQPAWQQAFLARPLAERQALARQMRAHSEQHHAQAAEAGFYADVDEALAARWLAAAHATTLLHGHTHRPADHALGHDAAGHPLRRVVLSDWHVAGDTRRAQALRISADGALARVAVGPM